MSGNRLSPQLKDRGRDNVLPGRGYCTPHGAVIDGSGALMKWWLAGETEQNARNTLRSPQICAKTSGIRERWRSGLS